MFRTSAVLALTFVSTFVLTTPSLASPSAQRPPHVSFETMAEHYRAAKIKRSPYFRGPTDTSAMASSVALDKVDVSKAPSWNDIQAVTKAFEVIRDKRFLEDNEHPEFPRRMSWLYPDDGCFARAELAARELKAAGHASPAKIFAFGNLSVKTANSELGEISWWYHVVVGYRVGKKIVVFDPAIESSHPMTLETWAERMGGAAANIEVSVCAATAYEPDSNCKKGSQSDPEIALRDQRQFLPLEWDRVESLGLEPEKVLGEEPPWVKAAQILPLQ